MSVKIQERQRTVTGHVLPHHVISPSLLTLLYVEQQHDGPWIARYLGCSVQTVYRYLRMYGMPRRPRPCGALFAGRRHTAQSKARISAALKGRRSPNKGNVYTEEQRAKLRVAAIRRNSAKNLPHPTGSSHWNWQGGISQPNERERKQVAVRHWRVAVLRRDGYACQVCHCVGGRLHAHHIKTWAKFPDLRFDVANGVTLCELCHALTHGRILKRGSP